ncbi:MAG TPA: phosphoglycerate dehydrogenase [Dehalococcoidia bacterium]|nr:phosphoglycerate dehydrogenase [Dehalococcoidia bacterium]
MDSRKILVADPITPDGVALLQRGGEVDVRTGMPRDALVACVGEYAALVVRSETQVTREVIEAGKQLQVIGRAGIGVDNIDVDAATERGILVVNAPLGNTISTAEHAIALMLALARNIPQAHASVTGGQWDRSKFRGYEVRGKTLGIVGLGNVGSEVARRAKGLDMNVIARDPYVAADRFAMLGVEVAESIEELMERADFVTLHTVAKGQVIGEAELARARPSLRLINTARGNHVDYTALLRAIDEGRVAGAAIDVFPAEPPAPDDPLLHHEKVIVTPHLGALTAEAQERVAVDVAEQILAVLRGQPAQYAVNAPMIAAESMALLAPYVSVAEKVASLATQLTAGQLDNIEIGYMGAIGQHDTTALRAAVIRGLLSGITEERVTIVNASLIAESRGMRIVERKAPAEDYMNLVSVAVHTSSGAVRVAGTHAHDGPRIVAIGDFDSGIDIPTGSGWLLLCENQDQPGMVGAVGKLLGDHDINISFMSLGRESVRGRALMVLGLDDEPAPHVLDELRQHPNILSARLAKFD